jgi:hypothetical protein
MEKNIWSLGENISKVQKELQDNNKKNKYNYI